MKRFITVLAILTCLLPLGAQPSGQYYSLSLQAFPYFAIPHFKDEIPMRTAGGAEISAEILGYRFNTIEGSLAIRYRATTPSIPHGFYQARGFDSFGADLRFAYSFNDTLSLFATAGTEINFYRRIKEAFASFSTSVGVEFTLVETAGSRLSLGVPLTIHLRKEITAIQSGVSVRYQLFPKRREN
ncbi:MAG: hypothetical protein WC233_00320 [Sphaerochaeta sp.]|jgi:hypothetical protein